MNQQASNSSEFDYSTLDSEARIIIQQRASEIKSLMRQTVQNIIEIGEKLTQAKAELGHGNFTRWLKYEFEWQERSARNFMRVAETFKTAKFADLDFAASALYLLAAPSVSEGVRQTALEMAQNGETITYSKAKRLIGEYQQQEPAEAIEESITNEAMSVRSPKQEPITNEAMSRRSPIVDVLVQTESELQMEISYSDLRLKITAEKDNFVVFLKQIRSNPNLVEEILQQIDVQTE